MSTCATLDPSDAAAARFATPGGAAMSASWQTRVAYLVVRRRSLSA